MAELRRDRIIGRWVVVRGHDVFDPSVFEKEDHTPRQIATCPLCPGREDQTPSEIEAARAPDTEVNRPGWSVRVVPNKFPALRIEGELDKRGVGIFDMSNGVGAHEIVIETAEHTKQMADFTKEELLEVLKKYQSRLLGLAQDKRFKYIQIFKNFGESSGASLEHEHSQIIALPMVPKYVQEELDGGKTYYNYRGRCVFCDMIDQEFGDKDRIVSENDDFLCFCPYVPRYAFETWIMPKEHNANFCTATGENLFSLAGTLKDTLSRIKKTLSNPSYNFYLHTAPIKYKNEESYHWHIEIIPKLTHIAGFEWGTGFYIVPVAPDVASKHLREGEVQ